MPPIGPRSPGSIDVRDLSKHFRGRQALSGITFSAPVGTVVAVIGPNGSGKSTLLRILAGVLTPDAGESSIAGEGPGRGLAGYAGPGDRGLYWRLTGRQNLEFFARLAGLRASEAAQRAGAIGEALGAAEHLSRRMSVCSTGQRRRLTLAQAFVAGQPVVLLDEPFADLDEDGCRAVADTVRSWAENGGLVLYASPLPEGGPAPDVTLTLEHGRLVSAA